jgi:hypothetical protein
MTLDSSQKVAFLSIAPITYLLPVPKGRSDGASLVIDGRGRPEMLEGTPRKRVSGGSPATPAPAGSCRKPDLTSSTQAHSRVTLDAPDTCSRLSAQRLSDFAQNRHPEPSALQIYRKETALVRGVEGPRRRLSYRRCSGLFNHRSPEDLWSEGTGTLLEVENRPPLF